MEAENSQDFEQRLNQWIASQGLWFQLRHSLSSGSGYSAAVFHLLRVLLRVGVVALVAGLVGGYFLLNRVNSDKFREEMRENFKQALNASDTKISGFRREQGEALVRKIGATGTENAFFQSLEAGNLQFDMGFLAGVGKEWNAGVVRMNRLDAEIRAGANSEEAAAAALDTLLQERPGFRVLGLEVSDAKISWGYFDRASGKIEDSRLVATRAPTGWRLRFEDGFFSQNWLNRFEIAELVLFVSEEGLVVEEGLLRAGEGTVRFEDVAIRGSGTQPRPSGKLVFERVPLEFVLPSNLQEMMEGSFSGSFELGGSTNTKEGVTFTGSGNLDGPEAISVRSELHLLRALDVVDAFNSYKRVDFLEGSFEIATGSGELVLSKLNLQARELMEIQGRITVRRPASEDLDGRFGIDGPGIGSALGVGDAEAQAMKMNLKAAAEAAKQAEDEESEETGPVAPQDAAFFDEIAEERRLRREAKERARNLYVFSGGVRVLIPGDAFQRSRELRERFPIDQASGRIGIDVPLEGTLSNITFDLAQQILSRGASD